MPGPPAPAPAETDVPGRARHCDHPNLDLDLDELAAALIDTGLLHPPPD